MTQRKIGRQLAAGAGAIALAMAGVLATSSAAFAAQGEDGTPPGNATEGTTGTLVIHKHAGTATDDANNGTKQDVARPPLAGAEFTVCKVAELETPEAWVTAENAKPGDYTCANDTAGAIMKTTGPDGSATFADLGIGLYKVVETKAPDGVKEKAADFLVTIPFPSQSTATPPANNWLWTVHAYPKNILDSDSGKTVADPNAHGLGSIVPWQITTRPLGSFNDGAPLTKYVIKDVLNDNLQYNSTISLKYVVPGEDAVVVPVGYYTVAPAAAATTGGGEATITFNKEGLDWLNGLQAGTKLVWNLDTKVVGVGSLENKAFENTGGDDVTTGNATTEWGAAKLLKYEANKENKVLAGAEFQVFDMPDAGTCAASASEAGKALTVLDSDVFTSDANGVVSIPGLYVGKDAETASRDYCVYETKAPAGYKASTEAIKITVKPGAVTDGTWSAKVANAPTEGPDLPLTGAQGTLLMTVGGLLLVGVGTGALVLTRRRHNR